VIDFYRTQDFEVPSQPLKAGIFGASGTTGVEMARLLVGHPCFELVFATSREFAGQSLRAVDPVAPEVLVIAPEDVLLDGVDVVFTCLPHGHSARCVEMCHEAGPVVVDLSGDLRLRDAALHDRTYGSERNHDLIERSVYGLTETMRAQLTDAKIVSNPGCYPTCVGLGIYPLAQAGKLSGTIVANAVSGVSGAGRKANATTHFCSAYGDVRPYNVGRKHRHVAEMEQSLTDWMDTEARKINLIFNPHLVPLERGMLATIVVPLPGMSLDDVHQLYSERYDEEPFIDLLPAGETARIRTVANTNLVSIGVAEAGDDHFVITSAIDNVLKGAAGQALQNANLVFGLPETMGLGVTVTAPIKEMAGAQ